MSLKQAYATIIREIGEDLDRPGLKDTPDRAAKAFEFLNRGYKQNVDDVVNNALFPSDCDEMVVVKGIELYSLCEHHLLPFIGKVHVRSEEHTSELQSRPHLVCRLLLEK